MKPFATITVIGRDKTGVIARVTSFLFEQKANIEALEEQVTRGQFAMALQASWSPNQFKPERIRQGLMQLGQELGMEVTVRFTEPRRHQRVAIFVTKESHGLETLMRGFRSRKLKAEPVCVVSNRTDLKAEAQKHEAPFFYIPWNQRNRAEKKALDLLERHEVDFIVLARFMKILSPEFVWRFKNKIINVHPSLLPSFPGPQAYRQAYEHGVKIIGATAHFVSMHLDEGPIIAQASFAVRPKMSLKEIVASGQKLESQVLFNAVRLYLARRLDVYWGIVKEV